MPHKGRLFESDVLDAVENTLRREGFERESRVDSTPAKGVDLVVRKGTTVLRIEAKGQTSERRGSKRYETGFDSAQLRDHFGQALLRAARGYSDKQRWAIALPGDDVDRRLVEGCRAALTRLNVSVFLVSPMTQAVELAVGSMPT